MLSGSGSKGASQPVKQGRPCRDGTILGLDQSVKPGQRDEQLSTKRDACSVGEHLIRRYRFTLNTNHFIATLVGKRKHSMSEAQLSKGVANFTGPKNVLT